MERAVEVEIREQMRQLDTGRNINAGVRNRMPTACSLEDFSTTIEQEDYPMGEMPQRAAASGLLKEAILGRSEPALHHFHNSYREALNLPPLERIEQPGGTPS